MSKEIKPCYTYDIIRDWFELYGNQNLERAKEEYSRALNELYDYQQKDQQIAELKKQLAEKDKEYQSFKKIADENVNYLKNRILEETKNYNQDKISFAVEQLTLFKNSIVNKMNNPYSVNIKHILSDFDNQINELKEEIKNE